MELTKKEVHRLMLVLRNLASAQILEDEEARKRASARAITGLRRLGSTIWPQILSPEAGAHFAKIADGATPVQEQTP